MHGQLYDNIGMDMYIYIFVCVVDDGMYPLVI